MTYDLPPFSLLAGLIAPDYRVAAVRRTRYNSMALHRPPQTGVNRKSIRPAIGKDEYWATSSALTLCGFYPFRKSVAQAGVSSLPHVFNLSSDDKGNPGKDQDTNGNKGELQDNAKAHMEVAVDVPEKNFTMGMWIKTGQGDVGIDSVLDGPAGAGGHDHHFFLKDEKINFRT
ncbi:hypothetical protein CMK14_02455 [Candidatus Poribacteria bacterium]|nr:hypothetical protein [Candidatus Poribacteria bacterium]